MNRDEMQKLFLHELGKNKEFKKLMKDLAES